MIIAVNFQFKQLERRSLKKSGLQLSCIPSYIISLLTGDMNSNKLTSLPMCGFIAQLIEHRTGTAEVTGSNLVEA